MLSGLIPGLNSVGSPENELLGQVPASLQTLFKLPNQLLWFKTYSASIRSCIFSPCLSYLRRSSSDSGDSLEVRTLIVWSTAVVVFMVASLAWLFRSKKKKKKKKNSSSSYTPLIIEATGDSSELYGDALFNGNQGDSDPFSNNKYIEELQVQEALMASILPTKIAKHPSPSIIHASTKSNPKPVKITNEVGESSQSFCEICMETIESWQMFRNESCSHSFCYDCTRNHIVAKVQDNIRIIACPGINCKAILDPNACRLMIPKDIIVRWDETLCRSLIDDSQMLYCPYRDCLAMLVNDSGEIIREINCPVCRRSICGYCRTPWHLEFTCEEFQKLSGKKKGGEDVMVKELAKKKNWRKCPHCKYYVEKAEGCIHITCRCGYEFCYSCGSKWSGNHGSCRQRS